MYVRLVLIFSIRQKPHFRKRGDLQDRHKPRNFYMLLSCGDINKRWQFVSSLLGGMLRHFVLWLTFIPLSPPTTSQIQRRRTMEICQRHRSASLNSVGSTVEWNLFSKGPETFLGFNHHAKPLLSLRGVENCMRCHPQETLIYSGVMVRKQSR